MTGSAAIRDEGGGVLRFTGALVFATVPGLLGEFAAVSGGHGELTIDLAEVSQTDSAALALLLEWMEQGRRRGVQVHFTNLPDSLMGIARLSNVERLLLPESA
jgi:phospholipid transport system transporter-binding protein